MSDQSYNSFITQVLATSKLIKDNRTKYAVLAKAVEELGELAQEVMIDVGDHYKPQGKDGIIGEAVDLMVCCIDLIYNTNKDITEEELQSILAKKLEKWVEKAELQSPGCTAKREAFFDILTFKPLQNEPGRIALERGDGSFVYMTAEYFYTLLYSLDRGTLKGRYEFIDDRNTVTCTHIVFGDIDVAIKEYEEEEHG